MAQTFKVEGTKLYDANHQEFIMRGINVPLVWFLPETLANFGNIKAATNSNTLRIVWELYRKLPDQYFIDAIDSCIKHEMIPVLEIHDVTGKNDIAQLWEVANWWASKADYINSPKVSKYIIINIANEWGDWHVANKYPELWEYAYKGAIKIIRDAGITCPLMIDGPDWGKDLSAPLKYGQNLLAADPLKNLIFSVHTYCIWNDPVNFDNQVQQALDKGLCVVSGELANFHWSCGPLDAKSFMRTCQTKGVGYMAWSWTGNAGDDAPLDLSLDWEGKKLSDWGKEAILNENGIKATAKPCSYFKK